MTEFEHRMDRKTMSHDSLLVVPKPVKAGLHNGANRFSYRGIRSSWSSVNLSGMRRIEPTTPSRPGAPQSPTTALQRSSSAMQLMSGSRGGDSVKYSFPESPSRTPSPILGHVDMMDDDLVLMPERSMSPIPLDDRMNPIRPAEDDESDILQVVSEIQHILFHQQRKSIERSDSDCGDTANDSNDGNQNQAVRRSTGDRKRRSVERANCANGDCCCSGCNRRRHSVNGADTMSSVDLEHDTPVPVLSISRMGNDAADDVRSTFRPFHYDDYAHDDDDDDDEQEEEEEEHMTSISMDAIQHYLDEYSLHDHCTSPPVRVFNGIAFDESFLKKNHSSHFSVGSLDRIENSGMLGAEIGLFSISPVSSLNPAVH